MGVGSGHETMLAFAIELNLSAIRRCPLFGVSAIREFLKYSSYIWKKQLVHSGRCPLFGVSAKRGSTV